MQIQVNFGKVEISCSLGGFLSFWALSRWGFAGSWGVERPDLLGGKLDR